MADNLIIVESPSKANTIKNMDKISNSLSINNVEDRIYIEIRSVVSY